MPNALAQARPSADAIDAAADEVLNVPNVPDLSMNTRRAIVWGVWRTLYDLRSGEPCDVSQEAKRYREIARTLREIHNNEEHFPMLVIAADTIDKLLDDLAFSVRLTAAADERTTRMMALLEQKK